MTVYRIVKRFPDFEAAHRLLGLPWDHQCARLHGHTYTVELTLQSRDLNKVGFVKDFGELKEFRDYLKDNLDHQLLNEVYDFNPTCENLAKRLFQVAYDMSGLVVACTVYETRTGSATYYEDAYDRFGLDESSSESL